jgi:hypothetical protein
MYLPKYAVGELNHPCKMAMRLASDHFADTSLFEGVKNRSFTIFRWQSDLDLYDQKYSGFVPWLHYYKKWSRYEPVGSIPEKTINGKPMVPMHYFFKDLEAFQSWLGEDGFRDLLVDLL